MNIKKKSPKFFLKISTYHLDHSVDTMYQCHLSQTIIHKDAQTIKQKIRKATFILSEPIREEVGKLL